MYFGKLSTIFAKITPYCLWLFIFFVGTFVFYRYQAIQSELINQQGELSQHQLKLIDQEKINEQLRSQRSAAISEAILQQCVQDYRVDGKLVKVSTDLLQTKSIQPDVKKVISDFLSEIAQNQGALQCQNPLPKRLRAPNKV